MCFRFYFELAAKVIIYVYEILENSKIYFFVDTFIYFYQRNGVAQKYK